MQIAMDQKPFVSLFTRPRRFGKTLNMDMLRVFFEISDMDTSQYFKDKDIWKCGEAYRAHQGKYPGIIIEDIKAGRVYLVDQVDAEMKRIIFQKSKIEY